MSFDLDTNDRHVVADVLDAMHDDLLVHGWVQGTMYEVKIGDLIRSYSESGSWQRTSPACMLGALQRVFNVNCHDRPLAFFPASPLWTAVRQAFEAHTGGIEMARYNDTPGRTLDEVLDALRQTAKEQRQ